MQNVDFSRRIKHSADVAESAAQPLKLSDRAGVRTLAIAIVAFTIGIVAGVQLMRARGTESLVRYPDQPRESTSANRSGDSPPAEEPRSLANIADEPGPRENRARGRYLIKIGSFSPDSADRLAKRLARIEAISDTRPVLCQGLKEESGRGLLFRIEAEQGKENLFLGCFETPARAHEVLEAVKSSDVAQASSAVVFEIE
jgi:hypothetical protein